MNTYLVYVIGGENINHCITITADEYRLVDRTYVFQNNKEKPEIVAVFTYSNVIGIVFQKGE